MLHTKVNDISVEDLFSYYDRYNFLYPGKKKQLQPIFSEVRENWEKALTLPWEYFLLLTYHNEDRDQFASVSAWRSTPSSYCIQHMVSNHPGNTRPILLHFLYILHGIRGNAIQVYFQPKTRFANNMFQYLADTGGSAHSFKHSFSYFKVPSRPGALQWSPIFTEPLSRKNQDEVLKFVATERSSFYAWVQDLDGQDFELSEIDKTYRQYNTTRSRKVIVFRDEHHRILGIAIVNKASLGLNFSLLENATELILNSTLPRWILDEAVNHMLHHIQQEYEFSLLEQVPVLVDTEYEDLVRDFGGQLMRIYDYFSCDHTVISTWQNYLVEASGQVRKHLEEKQKITT